MKNSLLLILVFLSCNIAKASNYNILDYGAKASSCLLNSTYRCSVNSEH